MTTRELTTSESRKLGEIASELARNEFRRVGLIKRRRELWTELVEAGVPKMKIAEASKVSHTALNLGLK